MDINLIRELIEAAKQMEEILGRNGVERPDLRWSERITAAESALAEEATHYTVGESILANLDYLLGEEAENALRLADELSAIAFDPVVYEDRSCYIFQVQQKASEYRRARGLEKEAVNETKT